MMYRFLLAVLACCVLALPSCTKETVNAPTEKPPTPVRPDTVVRKDTTPIKPPTSSLTKTVWITVLEAGSQRPARHCTVSLASYYVVNYPSTRTVYNTYRKLGVTDEAGKLRWEAHPDSVVANSVLFCTGNGYLQGDVAVPIKAPFSDTYVCEVLALGTVRLRIRLQYTPTPGKDGKSAYLLEVPANRYNNAAWEWPVVQSLHVRALPFDTTVLVRNYGPRAYSYALRYGVDASSFDSYSRTGGLKEFALTFRSRDTTDFAITVP